MTDLPNDDAAEQPIPQPPIASKKSKLGLYLLILFAVIGIEVGIMFVLHKSMPAEAQPAPMIRYSIFTALVVWQSILFFVACLSQDRWWLPISKMMIIVFGFMTPMVLAFVFGPGIVQILPDLLAPLARTTTTYH